MKVLFVAVIAAIGFGVLEARAADFSKARIDVIVKARTERYWSAVFDGAREAAKDLGLSVETLGAPSGSATAEQIQILKNATARRPTGIVIAPSTARALAQPIAAATKAGIPVIVIGSRPDTTDYASLVATDDEAAGEKAADAMADCIRRTHGKIAGRVAYLTGLPRTSSLEARDQGFTDGLKKYAHLEIIATPAGGDHARRALSEAERLSAHGAGLVGIFADNGVEGGEAGLAISREHDARHICLVAFGATHQELTLVRSGLIDALIVQDPYMVGYAGVWYALAAAHGVVLPKRVSIPVGVITNANVDTPKTAGLLDPKKYALTPFVGAR